jgi:hypothetical protein
MAIKITPVLIGQAIVSLAMAGYWLAIVISNPTNFAFVTVWMWGLLWMLTASLAILRLLRLKRISSFIVRYFWFVIQGAAVGIWGACFVMFIRVPSLFWGAADSPSSSLSFFQSLGWAHLQDWLAHQWPLLLLLLLHLAYHRHLAPALCLEPVGPRASMPAPQTRCGRVVQGLQHAAHVLSHAALFLAYMVALDPAVVYRGALTRAEFFGLTVGIGGLANAATKALYGRRAASGSYATVPSAEGTQLGDV